MLFFPVFNVYNIAENFSNAYVYRVGTEFVWNILANLLFSKYVLMLLQSIYDVWCLYRMKKLSWASFIFLICGCVNRWQAIY